MACIRAEEDSLFPRIESSRGLHSSELMLQVGPFRSCPPVDVQEDVHSTGHGLCVFAYCIAALLWMSRFCNGFVIVRQTNMVDHKAKSRSQQHQVAMIVESNGRTRYLHASSYDRTLVGLLII